MEQRNKTRLPIIISILLHLGLLVFLMVNEHQQKTVVKPEAVDIEWVNLEDFPAETEMKQIVQQADKSINEKAPEKDYKLSKNNQDLVRETKAQKNGEFQNKKNQRDGKTAQNQKTADQQKKASLDRFKPSLFDNSYSQKKLAPSPVAAHSGAEVSQNDDYLKDVVAGAETLLKTREFVYYGYYNRIKSKLKQHWEPRIKKKITKILRRGRQIASINDKITRLVITLDQTGDLVRIQVKNASGYNDLDDAAIEAFRAAAPFPNPPLGIVDTTGNVHINWDFVLETWSAPGWLSAPLQLKKHFTEAHIFAKIRFTKQEVQPWLKQRFHK